MPRRAKVIRREASPDSRYHSRTLAAFINKTMHSGKKSVSERQVYGALDHIEAQARRNPLDVFEQALRNATPMVEGKPRRVGGATHQGAGGPRAPRRDA